MPEHNPACAVLVWNTYTFARNFAVRNSGAMGKKIPGAASKKR